MTPSHKENFITTKEAGEISGYAPDYLARLARGGKIVGRRVGHSWLIERESLTHFLGQQGERKIDYARSLARSREAEYRAHRSAIHRATKALTKQFSVPQRLTTATSSLRSQALALSVALAVVVSAALVARAAAEPRLAHMATSLADEATSGFNATFGNIPSRIIARIEKAGADMRAPSERIAMNATNASAEVASSFLTNINLSPLQMAIDDERASRVAFVSISPAHAPATPVAPITIEDVRASVLGTYAFVTTPSLAANALARAYVAFGVDAYAAIGASFSAYRSLVERSGAETLALAAASRDALATAPRLVDRVNLAFGTAIIEATHAAIHADVATAYGVAEAAPASARAVFGAEYVTAERFLALTGSVSGNYLALVDSAGRLAYTGTTGTHAFADVAVSRIAHAPATIENAYLGMLGKVSLALEGPTSQSNALAAALPTLALRSLGEAGLSVGERAALAVYETLNGFMRSTTAALASLLAPPPTIVLPTPVFKRTPPAVRPTANSYPTYTTVVQGVSPDFVDKSLTSLRADILATTAGMIRPVQTQTVTNAATIQSVNRIEDLSNLIVRNGDFRGGSLTNGTSVSATTGSFTNLTGGSFSAGATSLATTTITGTATIGSLAGVVGANAGTLYAVASSSLFGFTPLSNALPKGNFIVGDDAGVAQATSSLFISSTGSLGIGTTSPLSLFSLGTAGNAFRVDTTGAVKEGIWNGTTISVGNGGTGQTTFTSSQLLYGNGTGALASVATSSFAASGFPASYSGTFGAFVGGAAGTWTYWGLATSSQPASSNLLVSNGTSGVYGIATTSATCGTGVSCTGFNVLGASNPSFALAALGSAGVLGAQTATTPTVQATSTLYGTGTGGQVLGWNNTTGGIGWVATSTGGGAVSSVSNADGTLTISPTTGAVVSSLNLANANYWTALQNFTNASTSQLTATSSVYLATLGGSVGIGTTTPYARLSVWGANTTSGVRAFEVVNSASTTSFAVDNAGNATTGNNMTVGGTLTVNGLCVAADTRLRRRRKAKKGEEAEADEEGYIYDEVMIKDIETGDEVATLDQKTGRITWSRVNGLLDTGIQPLIKIRTLSGKEIRTTAAHPYLVRVPEYRSKILHETQKLYRFEVDLSIKIEQYAEDTIVAVANDEYSFTVLLPRKVKQAARDMMRRRKQPKKGVSALYAMAIVEALARMSGRVHELAIDTDYVGHNDTITSIVHAAFPAIEVSFARVGKKSPAHFAAYGVHVKQKTADYAATVEALLKNTESAPLAPSPASPLTSGLGFGSLTRTLSSTDSVFETDEFVNKGKWTTVSELKVGQSIAVAYGAKAAWERVVAIEELPAEQVFDIEVEGTHNFIGNDIVAHNTAVFNQASTTMFTNSGATWLTGLSASSLIATDANKLLIATTSIGVSNLALPKGNFIVGSDAGVAQATSTIFISSTGNVGIGTTGPSAKLQIVAGTAIANAQQGLNISDLTTTTIGLGLASANNSSQPTLFANTSLAFQTNGNERMRIDSSGNVGIGTTDPGSNKLQVVGASGSNMVIRFNVASAGTYLLLGPSGTESELNADSSGNFLLNHFGVATGVFNSVRSGAIANTLVLKTGNVGIGTVGPGQLLSLEKTSGDVAIKLRNSGAGLSYTLGIDSVDSNKFKLAYGGDFTTPRMTVDSSGNVGIGTTTPVTGLSVSTASNNSYGNLALASSNSNNAGISFLTGGGSTMLNWQIANNYQSAGGLSFMRSTTNTGVPTSPVMELSSTGNVGIGTTVPGAKLHVVGPSGGESARFTDGVNSTLKIVHTAASGMQFQQGDSSVFLAAYGNGNVALNPTSGNVGIGTTGPLWKLDVQANVAGDWASIIQNTNATGWGLQSKIAGGANTDRAFAVRANNVDVFTVTGSGNVGIGTANPDSIKLDVEDDIEIGTGTTGCVRDADNTTLVGSCVSDRQLKTNITAFPSDTLDKLAQLTPVSFEWRNDEFGWLNGQLGTNYGLIAQDVEQVFPEMVHTDDKGYKRVSYDIGLSMRMLEGIRELDARTRQILGSDGVLSIVPGVESQCVTGDTRLRRRRRRADGSFEFDEIEIKNVEVGDEVASLDEAAGVVVYSRVNALVDMGEQEVYELVTKSGRSIRTTSNHPFLARVGAAKS